MGTKALTLHQPWASLIAVGAKTIETRGWSTKYRGPLAIHAAKVGASLTDAPEAWEALGAAMGCTGYDAWYNAAAHPDYFDSELPTLPFGAVVAVAELVDVVPIVYADERPRTFPCIDEDSAGLALWYGAPLPLDVEHQRPFGDFTPGRYAWLMENVRPIDPPIPAKGKQGLWTWAGATQDEED